MRKLSGLIFIIVLIGCTAKEELKPLYAPAPLELHEFTLRQWVSLPEREVPMSTYMKVVDNVAGWIPVFGESVKKLLELPFDMTFAILPAFLEQLNIEMPRENAAAAQELLEHISELRIRDGYLQVSEKGKALPPGLLQSFVDKEIARSQYDRFTVVSRRPTDPSCGYQLSNGCGVDPDLQFIEDLQVYLVFQNTEAPVIVSVARANWYKDYNEPLQMLRFHSTGVDLKPMLRQFGAPSVKVLATGRPTMKNMMIRGKLLLEANLKTEFNTPSVLVKKRREN